MKITFGVLAVAALWVIPCGVAHAQGKSLASTMDVYVFPTKGQNSAKQSTDEAECYEWAVGNAGVDPFDLGKQEKSNEQQAQAEKEAAKSAGQDSGARGAVRGAAAGALIGEIANDDASEGAAWGAAAGAIRGRRMGREAQAQAQQQAAAQAEQREQATEEQMANFKKAFLFASKQRITWSSIDGEATHHEKNTLCYCWFGAGRGCHCRRRHGR